MVILNLFIVAWGFFFFVLILFNPHARPLAKYMLLLFIGAQMIVAPFLPRQALPEFTYFLANLFYLSGPAFYFYIKALRSPSFRFRLWHLGHFVPAFLIPLFFHIFPLRPTGQLPVDSLHLLIMVSWFLAYLIASLRLLPGNWWSLRELFAPGKDTIWRWLYVPTMFYVSVYAIRFAVHLIEVVAPAVNVRWRWLSVLTLFTRLIFYYLLAIGSYRHRHVYETEEEAPDEQDIEESVPDALEGGKYQKPPLDDEQVRVLWQRLNDYISKEEPFLDGGLKLPQLAHALGVSVHKLSQVINTCASQNFHDFVNSYRARKAGELIQKYASSDKSMLDLSLEAGFGNSATFYKYFKRYFSVTPAEYRRAAKNR